MDRKLLFPNERLYMYHASTSALSNPQFIVIAKKCRHYGNAADGEREYA
jgi:hypothetical protein